MTQRAILIGVVLAVAGGAVWAQNPPAMTDKAVTDAIEKGKAFLLTQRQADGSFGVFPNDPHYEIGPTAVALYALLESGANPQGKDMIKSIKWLSDAVAKRIANSEKDPDKRVATDPLAKPYEMGMAAQVYLSTSAKTGATYTKDLESIGKLLFTYAAHGGYHYDIAKPAEKDPLKWAVDYDMSCSQYGVLGVWAAALAAEKGISTLEIPREYWWKVMKHWMDHQNTDGGWIYQNISNRSAPAMTAAGVATMFVCYDNYFTTANDLAKIGSQSAEFKSLQRGLDWFDKNFKSTVPYGQWPNYYYYGIERVGLASGYKYFGTADWYKQVSGLLLKQQGAGGEWNAGLGPVVDTGLAMLFLIRGQAMVMFNKLEYDGDWRNRPRDLAALTRWLSNTYDGLPINWQIINLQVPVSEWHDAPMLYIAGSTEPKFTAEDVEKLRTYVLQGGTIFAVAEGGGTQFAKGIKDLCAKMFPLYKFEPMPDTIEMLSATRTARAAIKEKYHWNWVTNGIRPLVIQSDFDLSLNWQTGKGKGKTHPDNWTFESMAHLFACMTERATAIRHRATTPWPEMTTVPLLHAIKLARVQWKGNWNPEPLAMVRLRLLMANLCKTDVQLSEVAADKLGDSDAKIAYLTGTGSLKLISAEKDAIKKFIDKGGTLIVEAAGGNGDFVETGKQLIGELYPDQLLTLATNSSVFQVKGFELEKARYRTQTASKFGDKANNKFNLKAVDINGRPAVIFSAEDLTAGLMGYACLGVDGYSAGTADEPGMAFQLMRNILLYCAKLDAVTTSQPATSPADPSAIPGPSSTDLPTPKPAAGSN